jgi:hypothetical protein
MGRQLVRVPIDFSWPIGMEWFGFNLPLIECRLCGGTGMKPALPGAKNRDCDLCRGAGSISVQIDLPEGDGWQMWETTSGTGSAMSPVFETPEELARWLADTRASAFADRTATYEQWLAIITGPGDACSTVETKDGTVSGVEYQGDALISQKRDSGTSEQESATPVTGNG